MGSYALPNETGKLVKSYSDVKSFGKAAKSAAKKIREIEGNVLPFFHKNRLPLRALKVKENESYISKLSDPGLVVFERKSIGNGGRSLTR